MNICLFSAKEIDFPLSLNDERAKHIINILHKKEGDTFFAGIINECSGFAKITKIANQKLHFNFTPSENKNERPLFPIVLIVGFPRPIQLKRLLRDVAGLGVSQLYLTGSELGEKSYLQSNIIKSGEAEKLLLDGTVQAGSAFCPKLFVYNTLSNCLEKIMSAYTNSDTIKILLDVANTKCSLTSFLKERSLTNKTVIGAIGSERGWTNNERMLLQNAQFTSCSMGIRILRTETAVTVASSIILSAMSVV